MFEILGIPAFVAAVISVALNIIQLRQGKHLRDDLKLLRVEQTTIQTLAISSLNSIWNDFWKIVGACDAITGALGKPEQEFRDQANGSANRIRGVADSRRTSINDIMIEHLGTRPKKEQPFDPRGEPLQRIEKEKDVSP